jgi:AraC-like DNA-binding protein
VLRDVRRLEVPELDAFQIQVDVRTPSLRVGTQYGRNVASDFALLQRAAPFLHHLRRPQLTIMLEGYGRFDENGRREWLRPGVIAVSDQGQAGTDAFAGATCRWLVLDWDPAAVGAPYVHGVRVEPVAPRDLARLDEASRRLAGPHAAQAASEIVSLLRAWGLALAPIASRDIEAAAEDAVDGRIQGAFAERLSNLGAHPGISDLVAELGTSERQLSRRIGRIARRYGLPWTHWRAALHHTRLLQALRLLAAPGATTEKVARLTGFRAPTALCHAFEKGGLPSPGVLAAAARRDPLDGWSDFAFRPLGAEHAA